MPEIARPAGTPVCLMEKTKGAHLMGAYFARICELAGVATVEPPLLIMTARTNGGIANHGWAISAASDNPNAISTQPIWLVRSAPHRFKAPPQPAITRIAQTA
jgi:hypothetical protein